MLIRHSLDMRSWEGGQAIVPCGRRRAPAPKLVNPKEARDRFLSGCRSPQSSGGHDRKVPGALARPRRLHGPEGISWIKVMTVQFGRAGRMGLVPLTRLGNGTANVLVLALLSAIAETKANVIFRNGGARDRPWAEKLGAPSRTTVGLGHDAQSRSVPIPDT